MRYFLFGFFLFILIAGFTTAFFWSKNQIKTEIIPNQIIVYKEQKKLILFNKGKKYIYPIATGKNTGDKQKVGDCRTPIGKFKIVSVEKSDSWAYDFEDDDLGPIVGAYGPWFLRFDGKWEGIAIHGTHDESTIGKNDTHGCIRLKNKDLIGLKNMIKVGYPVEIL